VKRSVKYAELLHKSKLKATEAIGRQYNCTIVIEGTDARLEGTYPLSTVVDATSYFQPGYRFTKKFRAGIWDGRVKLFHRVKRTFPAGLVQVVYDALKDQKVRVSVDDKRYCPTASHQDVTKISLVDAIFDYPYDYQPACAAEMIKKQRGVVGVATNGGKTTIAALVIMALKVPTLFMVPNRLLLYQTQKALAKRFGVPLSLIGIIGDNHWEPKPWVTVATADTLSARLAQPVCRDFLKSIQLLIVDECHHQGSDTWYLVSRACGAFYRFGLSGTPLDRSDGADLRLVGVTGPLIYRVTNKELIERDISLQPFVHILKITKPLLPATLPYKDAHRLGIVENVYRNTDMCEAVTLFVDQGLSALVIVDEITHGELLDKKFWSFRKGSFYPHQFITGEEPMDVRTQALEDFRKGDTRILITTNILSEGVDLPNIDVLGLAAGGKSKISLLQRIGRGLRKGGKSEYLHIIETADFQNKHLLKHSLQRINEMRSQDCFIIEVLDLVEERKKKRCLA